jgi:hypothetical protein
VLWTRGIEPGISCRDLLGQVPPANRREIRETLEMVARITRRLHGAGFCHRDLYLDHFLCEKRGPRPAWILIDLARVEERVSVPWRRRVKDLASLEYSARAIGIPRTERLRGFRRYFPGPACRERRLLGAVLAKAARIEARELRRSRRSV